MEETVLAAFAALGLFLVVGTVASELALPALLPAEALGADDAPDAGRPEAELLLEVTVHHVERRLVNDSGEVSCRVVRTLSDRVAPVLLLDRERDDDACTSYEEIEIVASADSERSGRLARYDVELCPARSFSTTGRTADGVRLTSLELGTCATPSSLFFPPVAPEGFLQVMAYPHELPDEPGLVVACVAVEIVFDDGPTRVFQDMAWFETWSSVEEYPLRNAVRESKDPNVGCTHQGLDWAPELHAFPERNRGPHVVVREAVGP